MAHDRAGPGERGLGRSATSFGGASWTSSSHTDAEQEVYAQALTLVRDLDEYRALRLLEVREGVPSILWVGLLVGGVITGCFTYLFGMRTPRLHVLMVVEFTVVLVLVLYTIRVLEYPSTASCR